MLVLSRKLNEELVITVPPSNSPQQVIVMLVEASHKRSKLGLVADASIKIYRSEIQEQIDAERADPT